MFFLVIMNIISLKKLVLKDLKNNKNWIEPS